jgi:DNA polymerase III delta prime subunit
VEPDVSRDILLSLQFPTDVTVFDVVFNSKLLIWQVWHTAISQKVINCSRFGLENVIQTQNITRTNYLMKLYLKNNHHVLISGYSGVGKTTTALGSLICQLENFKIDSTLIHRASSDTPSFKLKIQQSLKKKRNGLKTILFVDDISALYSPDASQQYNFELFRMILNNRIFYDHLNQQQSIPDFHAVCTLSITEYDPHKLTGKIGKYFQQISLDDDEETILIEFSRFLSTTNGSKISSAAIRVVPQMIQLCRTIRKKYLPKPNQLHRVFTLDSMIKAFRIPICLNKPLQLDDFLQFCFEICHRIFGDATSSTEINDLLGNFPLVKPYTLKPDSFSVLKRSNNSTSSNSKFPDALIKILQESSSIKDLWPLLGDKNMLTATRIAFNIQTLNSSIMLVGSEGNSAKSISQLAALILNRQFYEYQSIINWEETLAQMFEYVCEFKSPVIMYCSLEYISELHMEDVISILTSGLPVNPNNIYAINSNIQGNMEKVFVCNGLDVFKSNFSFIFAAHDVCEDQVKRHLMNYNLISLTVTSSIQKFDEKAINSILLKILSENSLISNKTVEKVAGFIFWVSEELRTLEEQRISNGTSPEIPQTQTILTCLKLFTELINYHIPILEKSKIDSITSLERISILNEECNRISSKLQNSEIVLRSNC